MFCCMGRPKGFVNNGTSKTETKLKKPQREKRKVNEGPNVNVPSVIGPTINGPTVNEPSVNESTINEPVVNQSTSWISSMIGMLGL